MAGGIIEISYQSPPLGRWRRRVLRGAIGAAMIGITLWLADGQWFGRARLQVALLAAQGRCMTVEAAPDRVALEFDPTARARLLARGGYRSYVDPSPGNTAASPIIAWTELDNRLRALAQATEPVERFGEIYHGPGPANDGAFSRIEFDLDGDYFPATVFLHAMGKPGAQRLVAIVAMFGTNGIELNGFVWKPGGWRTAPVLCNTKTVYQHSFRNGGVFGNPNASPPSRTYSIDIGQSLLRVYAGQMDPSDPNRFSIRYRTATGSSRVAGRLLADDTVELVDQH